MCQCNLQLLKLNNIFEKFCNGVKAPFFASGSKIYLGDPKIRAVLGEYAMNAISQKFIKYSFQISA